MAVEYSLLTWAGLGTTVTFTDAGDIVNFTAHGAPNGHSFQFPDNAGNTLPTGLSKNTTYYLRQGADANKFTIYPTSADAIAGTNQITFTGTGSGTHKVIGAYWATLPATNPGGGENYRARYGSAGSERVYSTESIWRGALVLDYSKNFILEIQGKWTDTSSSGTLAARGYSITITTMINGARDPDSFHQGVQGAGWRKVINSTGNAVFSLAQVRTTIDGIECVNQAASGYGVSAGAPLPRIKNCILTANVGLEDATSGGVYSNNIAIGCAAKGYNVASSNAGATVYNNNLAVNCGTGFFGTSTSASLCNNISVGNTSNWSNITPTGYSTNNGGATGDTIWASSGGSTLTGLTTDIFTNYAGGDFTHSSGSATINAGISSNDFPPTDILGAVRPNYESATFPANLWDIGPFEFDHGEGEAPISVTFTNLQAGSTVRVFTTGTQTVLASTTNSGTTFDASGATGTVDYTIFKDGQVPIRVTGVALFDGIEIDGTQTSDPVFITPSGLAYGTTTTVNTSTKIFTLTTASTGQNWYSFWVQQYRSNSDLYNKPFPLQANGPNNVRLRVGYEFNDASSIAFLSRDGLGYFNTSGVLTAAWAAILTVGVSAGMQVRYQQSDGGTTVDAATTGNMDHLIQIYGDATHGNFDRTGYLVLKVQEMGYDQAEADAVALYGTLEDQLYVIGLAPAANGIATGNPSLANPPTITDHAGSPVTWNSKAFSLTIEDSAAGNTGTNIMRWLRYYFETGGTFQGKDAFNWHDLVQTNGGDFKTVRGAIYGDTGAALKGVRVITNGTTDPHGDFTLFTADDGTTYAPPVVANAEATILADSRVQLYNVTTDAEIDNVFNASTAYSYTITTEASVGDTLRLRVCKKGYEPTEALGVWAATGLTFLVTQTADAIYAAWGIDGETVTEFTLDVTGNIEIDANDTDGSTTKTRLGAWYNYALTTEAGIRNAYGAATFLAVNAIRINVDVLDLKIENVNATTALRFTDTDVRLYRSDGTSIIAATSYSIHNDYSGVPDVVETGVSGLTAAESNQLFAIPTTSGGLTGPQDATLTRIKQNTDYIKVKV